MSEAREAAVLMLLQSIDGEPNVLFTKRTVGLKEHSGEMCFPGGSVETGETLLETALREVEEELGIRERDVAVVAALDPVNTYTTNFNVTCFVGRLWPTADFVPEPKEVAEVVYVPLSFLLDPESLRVEVYDTPQGEREVYFFNYGEHEIWGATARMLKQFLDRYDAADPVLVGLKALEGADWARVR
ncbi:MAG: CoA pyrophosphatase [Chloroflexi bacterium]|nr:CoA pyrophosphatase [Chloroflexota bacterium]